jgi:hypothetical protein
MPLSGSFTRQTSKLTTSTRDYICSHKYTLLAQEIVTSNRIYFITEQQLNNILIYFKKFYGIVILTASILRIYVTQQGTNVNLPDNDT